MYFLERPLKEALAFKGRNSIFIIIIIITIIIIIRKLSEWLLFNEKWAICQL